MVLSTKHSPELQGIEHDFIPTRAACHIDIITIEATTYYTFITTWTEAAAKAATRPALCINYNEKMDQRNKVSGGVEDHRYKK